MTLFQESDNIQTPGSARLTRVYAAFIVALCLLANIPITKHFIRSTFALVPFATIGQSKIWNVVTAGFVELHPLHCMINVMFFITMGRWIETAWGPYRFLLYLLVVNIFSAAITSATMLSAFVATKASDLMYVFHLKYLFINRDILLE